MANSRVRAVLTACLIAAAAAAAFNGVPRLVGPLAADVGVVIAPRDPPLTRTAGGGLTMSIDHAPSICCEDFQTGFGFALLDVLVGGFPLSLLGISLGTRRRRGEALSSRWTPVLHAAFVVQAGSVALAGLLFVLATWEALTSSFGAEAFAFAALFLPTLICGALSLPSWHAVSNHDAGEYCWIRIE
jgi:hypothetical protein